jgi:hypothetical protein
MRSNARRVAKHVEPITAFLRKTTNDGIPANFFVILDTHSDAFTGNLQHAGGQTNGLVAPIDEVCTICLMNVNKNTLTIFSRF